MIKTISIRNHKGSNPPSATLTIKHEGGIIEKFELLSNGAIEAFNSWLIEGYTATHWRETGEHTND